MNNKLLYCFISHQSYIYLDSILIANMMKNINYDNYIIVYGGEKLSFNDSRIIHLDCPDDYCSLSQKINALFKYVTKNLPFDFYCKIDRTTKVFKPYDQKLTDYCGRVMRFKNRAYTIHFNKCPDYSKWYNIPYFHHRIRFCAGPVYFVSNESALIVSKDDILHHNYASYEDLYISKLLFNNNIKANFTTLNKYYYDRAHPKIFRK